MHLLNLLVKEGTKLLKLVQNEYIKVLKKKSTFLWIIVGFIITVAFHFMMVKVASSNNNNMTYIDGESVPYMSEAYVDYRMRDAKSYSDSPNSPDILYYQKIKDLSLYEADQWKYDALYTAYYTYYYNTLNTDSELPLTEEERAKSQKTCDDIVAAVQANDYRSYYTTLAKLEPTRSYDFEGKTDAILNPYQYRLDHNIDPSKDAWKDTLINNIMGLQDQLQATMSSSQDNTTIRDLYTLYKYRLDNNIETAVTESYENPNYDYSSKGDFWSGFESSTALINFISILIIIIAGGCIAGEFSTGTIKFLLINPVKRSKIVTSKYFMVVSFTFLITIAYYIVNVLLCLGFYGGSDVSAPYLHVVNNVVQSKSAFLYIASLYLYGSITVLCYGTMAFAISSLLRSSSVAIGTSVFLLISGNMITQLLVTFKQDWGRYLLFANTDLGNISKGISFFPNHSLTFACITLVVYMFVFLLTAYDGFVRREV